MLSRINLNKLDPDPNPYRLLYRGQPFTGIVYDPAWDDGRIIREVGYYNERIWGFYRTWHPNGNLESHREMIGGQDEGIGRWWYPSGSLWSEIYSELGVRVKQKGWNESGELIKDWVLPEDESESAYRMLQGRRAYPKLERTPEILQFEREIAEYVFTHPSDRVYYEKDFIVEKSDLIIQL